MNYLEWKKSYPDASAGIVAL